MGKQQVDEGIDAVIVDNVLAIRKGLTSRTSKDVPLASNGSDEGSAPINGIDGIELATRIEVS